MYLNVSPVKPLEASTEAIYVCTYMELLEVLICEQLNTYVSHTIDILLKPQQSYK